MSSESYSIRLLPRAAKDLKGLRPYTDRVAREIAKLGATPYLGEPKRGTLQGVRALEFSLPSRGSYRALYFVIEEERTCVVFLVGPHEGIYEKAERRYRALKRLREVP